MWCPPIVSFYLSFSPLLLLALLRASHFPSFFSHPFPMRVHLSKFNFASLMNLIVKSGQAYSL